jgi:hypothetical protein
MYINQCIDNIINNVVSLANTYASLANKVFNTTIQSSIIYNMN